MGGFQLNPALGGPSRLLLSRFSEGGHGHDLLWDGVFHQSTIATRPCHLRRRVWSTSVRSSNCILSERSGEMIWSLVVTPHILRILARSLRCRRCKSDENLKNTVHLNISTDDAPAILAIGESVDTVVLKFGPHECMGLVLEDMKNTKNSYLSCLYSYYGHYSDVIMSTMAS